MVPLYQEIFEPKTVFQGVHPKEISPVDKFYKWYLLQQYVIVIGNKSSAYK